MFCICKSLEKLDVSKWNTQNVDSITGFVKHCKKLKTVKDEYYRKNLLILETYIQKFASGGRDSNLWNGPSTLTVKENFTVFNFQSLLANKNGVIANAQMLLVLKWLDNEIIKNRCNLSLMNEWAVHNLLYYFSIEKSRTGSVDLDYPQKWYNLVIYNIFGPIALLLIS